MMEIKYGKHFENFNFKGCIFGKLEELKPNPYYSLKGPKNHSNKNGHILNC
jgi:hypothetical protein